MSASFHHKPRIKLSVLLLLLLLLLLQDYRQIFLKNTREEEQEQDGPDFDIVFEVEGLGAYSYFLLAPLEVFYGTISPSQCISLTYVIAVF